MCMTIQNHISLADLGPIYTYIFPLLICTHIWILNLKNIGLALLWLDPKLLFQEAKKDQIPTTKSTLSLWPN